MIEGRISIESELKIYIYAIMYRFGPLLDVVIGVSHDIIFINYYYYLL
jgi:hypothetical protein